jgi:hypothetical protein
VDPPQAYGGIGDRRRRTLHTVLVDKRVAQRHDVAFMRYWMVRLPGATPWSSGFTGNTHAPALCLEANTSLPGGLRRSACTILATSSGPARSSDESLGTACWSFQCQPIPGATINFLRAGSSCLSGLKVLILFYQLNWVAAGVHSEFLLAAELKSLTSVPSTFTSIPTVSF